jgi:hypothetical protein
VGDGGGHRLSHHDGWLDGLFHAPFAVFLTFLLDVHVPDPSEPIHELAIHLIIAAEGEEAKAKGELIGKARKTIYENGAGKTVRDVFKAVVEVQELRDATFFDGMEVSSWLYRDDRLVIEEGWLETKPAVGK